MRQLDFSNGKVEVLTLDELKATQTENYSNTQTPVGGIYHFDLIRRIVDHLDQAGLNPEIQEIFAANNADRYRPGVTVNQDLFREYGDFAVETHTLRRIYANINLPDGRNDETGLNVAVAYHQKGIQIGVGPYVYVCHNQTIVGAQDVFSTQRISQARGCEVLVKNVEDILTQFRGYLQDFAARRDEITRFVEEMRQHWFEEMHFNRLVTLLMTSRIRKDHPHRNIHTKTGYALSSSQINESVARYLINAVERCQRENLDQGFPVSTWWDALNDFNFVLKGDKIDIPALIPQHVGLSDAFRTVYNEYFG